MQVSLSVEKGKTSKLGSALTPPKNSWTPWCCKWRHLALQPPCAHATGNPSSAMPGESNVFGKTPHCFRMTPALKDPLWLSVEVFRKPPHCPGTLPCSKGSSLAQRGFFLEKNPHCPRTLPCPASGSVWVFQKTPTLSQNAPQPLKRLFGSPWASVGV